MLDFNGFETLKNAAEVCGEFGQNEKAIEFRQKIAEMSPNDFENKFKLAEILPKEGSALILQSLLDERNIPRSIRWQAIWKLYEFGEIGELPNRSFDSLSQFYVGLKKGDENYFLNSLIADNNSEMQSLQQLIRIYANSERPFAALKLAEIDKTQKSDELLNLLSKSAEKVGAFQKAIEFETAKSKIDEARINELKSLEINMNKRVTDFTVDGENTRAL
jgi:tetratricopeptide (TPR) repeat protein